jgi:hypothetical protein
MKKKFIIFFGTLILFAFSCTKTCICEDPDGKVNQIEINPSEKCSDQSGSENGTCS